MKCITCGAEAYPDTTADVTELGKCLVIVRNVPCHKCTECSEIIYTGVVVKWLEEIVDSVRQSLNEIAVFDYNSVVA